MAKQGQHKHDKHDHRLMPKAGRNNPRKSTPITTGPVKKQKRYAKQAAEHKDTARQAQDAHAHWEPDTTNYMTHEADSRAHAGPRGAQRQRLERRFGDARPLAFPLVSIPLPRRPAHAGVG